MTRQLALPFEPLPISTEIAWLLAAAREREWLAAGTSDAQRAARGVFDDHCESAAWLVERGYLAQLPREVRFGS